MTRPVVIVTYSGAQLLDVVGPLEVFSIAGDELGRDDYVPRVVSRGGAPVVGTSGLEIVVHGDLPGPEVDVDTVVVAGGEGTVTAITDEILLGWLRAVAPRVRRMTSVCSGAFLLAEAGLLEGRRATTHWQVCDLLADRYPGVEVDPEPIYVRDGPVATSAGITAGMDLALALVEEDHGADLAIAVARRLVLFMHRPGGQAQFSTQLAHRPADRDVLRDLQAWIAEHPDGDLSVGALARRATLSPRTFARAFRAETGVTPAVYVEQVRVEHARRLLETTDAALAEVARASGFGSIETLRRAFVRRVGTAPTQYRHRFGTGAIDQQLRPKQQQGATP